MAEHCGNNKGDREVGARWERNFCVMAAEAGLMFTPLQIGRAEAATASWGSCSNLKTLTLPDVTIWTAPGQHHEIKHKNPTKAGKYGLEVYRFQALMQFRRETRQRVYYTIHNWESAPDGRDGCVNRIEDWVSADVDVLNDYVVNGHTFPNNDHPSYVDGRREENVPQYFWPRRLWMPLSFVFGNNARHAINGEGAKKFNNNDQRPNGERDEAPIVAPFVIQIDGREKAPYQFSGLQADAAQQRRPIVVRCEWAHLETGDYSIKGHEHEVALERKSLADLYSTLGQHRERFQREHERLSRLKFGAVVIEATWDQILYSPPEFSLLLPKTVFRTFCSWTVRYHVPWFTAGSRRGGEVMTFRLLEKWWRERAHEQR